MVASFHGHKIDLATLRRKHSVSLKGTTLTYLMAVADRHAPQRAAQGGGGHAAGEDEERVLRRGGKDLSLGRC